jgi:hypothetical protein
MAEGVRPSGPHGASRILVIAAALLCAVGLASAAGPVLRPTRQEGKDLFFEMHITLSTGWGGGSGRRLGSRVRLDWVCMIWA